MRHAPWILLTLVSLFLAVAPADAQQARRVKLDKGRVQVGFPNVSAADSGFKPGLWVPVLVKFVEDEDGDIRLPVAVDGSIRGEIFVECADNDGVFNVYSQKFTIGPNESMQILTYVKVASTGPDLKITIKADGQTFPVSSTSYLALDVGQHLYLTLGDNPVDFYEALVRMNRAGGNFNFQPGMPPPQVDPAAKETKPRFAVYETNALNLPTLWFGYNAVDLAILVTTNEKFVDRLISERQSSPQLQALAEWVRRGGRLVVSVAPSNRDKVQRLLASPAWQPALPVVLAADSKTFKPADLNQLMQWSGQVGELPPKNDKAGKALDRQAVRLLAPLTVRPECYELDREAKDQVPLIVHFPHGLGRITVLAFDVKDPFMTEWNGRFKFWEQVVTSLAPKSAAGANQFNQFGGQVQTTGDTTSRLYQELEKFDTPAISFGWVVLFIFIYILVVGPIDYIILKLLFKRLELTWLTFPAVVITVSLLAYFTAYAIKGKDLKVNKIDLVDIDLRSALNEEFQPAGGRAFGTTWFTILSPRIENYTIGLEPVLYQWQPDSAAPAQPIEPTMSWLGRPEGGGMGASGRGRSPGLFSRTYSYAPNATGLRGVPIPVWTTKSFTASWETGLDRQKLPLEAKLTYQPGFGQGFSLNGTIKSNLPFDLLEVVLIYEAQRYNLSDLEKGKTLTLAANKLTPQDLNNWIGNLGQQDWQHGQGRGYYDPSSGANYDPTLVMRNLMFHEHLHANQGERNHAHRNLDMTWRITADTIDGRVKNAILVARLKRVKGPLEQLHAEYNAALATHLWLRELPGTVRPGEAKALPRPEMDGTLVQDTYIRVLLPVAPVKK
jgi:hypothetical protein